MVENLPPNNAAVRAVNGHGWGDVERLLHDISSRLRDLNASYYNRNRGKTQAAQTPEYLPNPEHDKPEQVDPVKMKNEREHLQNVLARPNPH